MAAPQSPGSIPTRTAPGTTLGRALMWPAVAAGVGMLLIYNSIETSVDDKPSARPAAIAPAAVPEVLGSHAAPRPVTPSAPAVGPAMSRSVPTRLQIPSLAVKAPFTDLSIGADGQLNPPPPNDSNLVGWFKGGVTPGERGAAIVAGHVDTTTGPAVFLQLQFLKPGSTVDITRADGSVATFKVDAVETFSKAKFPNKRVYSDTPSAQLRLITCGGPYNRKAKHYEDNVVAFAHLESSKNG
ncbi:MULTISPECIES: class F sortase [unclassified Streptomyces]|uniref:class F sortase n=1 Tax=unclassified Streptomyces TaxID=2593676 RepID=UPI002257CB43|nr:MULTISPECIES: class F sortase [unclassified Streptomyces]WSP57320.1 class F sortase [Streptomyces sp. NBC_01241]WSU21961.1 class F sortase [Streptomyces sp. NBC_01108]MCX4789140.1 class F sortase [Streptomyces sp. NBC_01221]MCX4795114.1 class F sortase [Streptomyces sp. NBC_01242]WSJ36419.1 class F sortase [Streptomyces sp. NBC_01321]